MDLKDRVAEAVAERKQYIVANQDHLTMKQIRSILEQDINVEGGRLDDLKNIVRDLVFQILQSEAQAPTDSGAALPLELVSNILGLLDHDTFILAGQVCKLWHQAMQTSEDLWECHLRRRYDAYHTEIKVLSWRATYRKLASSHELCYDCTTVTSRKTCGGWHRRALCASCSAGYEASRPGQRLMTKTNAKFVYRLRDKDLDMLPKLLDENPIHPSFHLMELYRKHEIRRAAIKRWGGIENMLKQMRPLP